MNHSSVTIRAETSADIASVHALHVRAFGQPQEAVLVDQLRAEGFAAIALVAELAGQIVGHILFSPVQIVSDIGTEQGLALAPVAVEPDQQRTGIGSSLIRAGLETATNKAERFVLVLGEPAYYNRFGFSAALTTPLSSPYAGEYFMALELQPNALQGVQGEVCYAEPFSRLS